MDTKGQLGIAEKISCKSVDKLDKNSSDMETKDIPHLSSPPSILANGGLCLSPITPDSNKENADLMSNFTSPVASPPTTGFYSQPDQSESGDDSYMMKVDDEIDSPSTPKEGVFDPFAPGPDKLMLAPICMKYLEESRSFVARRLNFTSVMTKKDPENVCESGFEDDMLLEAVYESLLEAIICKQAEDIVAAVDSSCCSSPETPPGAPRLTGIAETCPGAPLKAVKKSRNIEMSLCRKLEFEF
ncbi:hypothetical protein L6452_41821 [Arctium lappa]|uniref:Uncharacterized protein n=1 Tax=Arctium lappa TaxID=4217 RepID=A0ACB8XGK8_ARCLA|nr:hypothetical protein L6452_41821 [Arctium lappa]